MDAASVLSFGECHSCLAQLVEVNYWVMDCSKSSAQVVSQMFDGSQCHVEPLSLTSPHPDVAVMEESDKAGFDSENNCGSLMPFPWQVTPSLGRAGAQ